MIIDTSAIVAILAGEPERQVFERALMRADILRMSAVNWFESAIVLSRAGDVARNALDLYVERAGIVVVPVDLSQTRLAEEGWWLYGKGRHPARLNMGDCFAYALAKSMGEPLLFKGGDFPRTDIVSAV